MRQSNFRRGQTRSITKRMVAFRSTPRSRRSSCARFSDCLQPKTLAKYQTGSMRTWRWPILAWNASIDSRKNAQYMKRLTFQNGYRWGIRIRRSTSSTEHVGSTSVDNGQIDNGHWRNKEAVRWYGVARRYGAAKYKTQGGHRWWEDLKQWCND